MYFDVGTPLSNKYYLGFQHGEMYGLDHNMARFLPQTSIQLRPKTDIPGLYLTGNQCSSFIVYNVHILIMVTWILWEVVWRWNSFHCFFFSKCSNLYLLTINSFEMKQFFTGHFSFLSLIIYRSGCDVSRISWGFVWWAVVCLSLIESKSLQRSPGSPERT